MYDFSANQGDLSNITPSFSLRYKGIPVSFAGQKKHTCIYQVDVTLEGQTKSWGKTLDLNFGHTGGTGLIPILIQRFFHVLNGAK